MATKKHWQKGMVFGGEMMRCKLCGKTQKSDPKVESGWTAVTIDGHRYYFCPECFGNAKFEASLK
jgi:hypothetical protein